MMKNDYKKIWIGVSYNLGQVFSVHACETLEIAVGLIEVDLEMNHPGRYQLHMLGPNFSWVSKHDSRTVLASIVVTMLRTQEEVEETNRRLAEMRRLLS